MKLFYLILNFDCKDHPVKVNQEEFVKAVSFYSQKRAIRKKLFRKKVGVYKLVVEVENFAGDWMEVGHIFVVNNTDALSLKLILSVPV